VDHPQSPVRSSPVSVLMATALSSEGQATLLGIGGIVVSALAGLLSVFWNRQRRPEPPGRSASWADWEPGLSASGGKDEEEEERPGIQRRVQARVVLPPPLTAATVRSIVREELAVIREDIRQSGKRAAFWTGFGQGFVFYVCGIAFTLIASS
jgi:hypothetical protein